MLADGHISSLGYLCCYEDISRSFLGKISLYHHRTNVSKVKYSEL